MTTHDSTLAADDVSVAEGKVGKWAGTAIARDQLASSTQAGWLLKERPQRRLRKRTIARFPHPSAVTTAGEADRWAHLASAAALEIVEKSWIGVLLGQVSAGAFAGVVASIAFTEAARTSGFGGAVQTVVVIVVAGVFLGVTWSVQNWATQRATYRDAPLWRERAVAYEHRAEALRRAETAARASTAPVSPQRRQWWRRRAV